MAGCRMRRGSEKRRQLSVREVSVKGDGKVFDSTRLTFSPVGGAVSVGKSSVATRTALTRSPRSSCSSLVLFALLVKPTCSMRTGEIWSPTSFVILAA